MFISCGSVNLKWFLFLLVPILMYICNILEKNSHSEQNVFFFSYLRFFSRSLSFILWMILKKSLSFQNEKKEEEENLQKLDVGEFPIRADSYFDITKNPRKSKSLVSEYMIYKENMDNKKKNLLKQYKSKDYFILYTGLLDFISTTIKYFFRNLKYIGKVSGGLNILSSCTRLALMASLSYFFINNQKIHRHQYFSAIVTLIVAIISAILSFIIENRDYNENFLMKLILMCVPEILYCLMYICGIYYLMKKGNIYKLISVNGIIGLILSSILQLIVSYFNCNGIKHFFLEDLICRDEDNKIKTILGNFTSFENFGSFLTFLLIIMNFIEIICIWLLIYYFSISHFAAVYIIPNIFDYIVNNKTYKYKIIYIIGCLIIIFMALIYNEILILKFCGLDKNTKIEIIKRANVEYFNEDDNKNSDNIIEDIMLEYSVDEPYDP